MNFIDFEGSWTKVKVTVTFNNVTLWGSTCWNLVRITRQRFDIGSSNLVQHEIKIIHIALEISWSKVKVKVTLNWFSYGRPVPQAWLLPDLNTVPDNCFRENFL